MSVSIRSLRRLSAVVLLLSACVAAHPAAAPVPVPAAADIAETLFLIGDAGKPAPSGDPVLTALTQEASRDPGRNTVVFLGDNVYPRGVPDSASPDRKEAERRLLAQVAAVRKAGVPAIFVPGNHDWDAQGPGGWDAIRRQQSLLAGAGGEVVLLPEGGCPGPAVRDIGKGLRLIVLDTQWWLQAGPKPGPSGPGCVPDSETGITDSLAGAVATAGDRKVIVAAHHPLVSGGPHGGHFGWKDHVFPLRELVSWLWVPLPVLGSIYPLARQHGVSSQDYSAGVNRRMRTAIERALAEHPPLVYVSGHEHTLQVMTGGAARYLLVSGTGTYHHSSRVSWLTPTRYASSSAGYMRLDLLRDGRVRLGVRAVDGKAVTAERFSMWLE
jgi:hypothetical protein